MPTIKLVTTKLKNITVTMVTIDLSCGCHGNNEKSNLYKFTNEKVNYI